MLRVLLILGMCVSGVLFSAEKVIVVAVAGGTGSGKTTLAHKIQEALPTKSQLISQDSYYKDLSHLSLEEREKVNFDHPDSLDFALLKHDILELKEGSAIQK